MSKKALNCKLKDGVLTIEVGIQTIKYAAERHDDFWQPQTDKCSLVVSDAARLAKDVRYALLAEDEVGNTPISKMLDAAIADAAEQGSEGIDFDAMEKIQEAERAAQRRSDAPTR
jgi:hypothetical protein